MSEERSVYYDDGNVRMVLAFYRRRVFLHLSVKKWGPSVYRLMMAHWPNVRSLLKAIGYAKIEAYYEATNRTMVSFAGRFGFRESRRGRNIVFMEVANG